MNLTRRYARSLVRCLLVLAALAIPAAASGTYLLRSDGTGQAFSGSSSVQSAIDAAHDGDVVFVAPPFGYVPCRIIGKSITLMALPNVAVTLNSTLEIGNLSAGQRVVVNGFSVGSCWIHDNAGAVRIQYMTAEGGAGQAHQQCPGGPGGWSTLVENSSDVSFYWCVLKGAEGDADYDHFSLPGAGGDGGNGLVIENSSVAVYNSSLQGGLGGTSYSCAGDGGTGCSVDASSFLFLSKSAAVAGRGGDAYAFISGPGGAGGIGLAGSGTVHYVATQFAGAAGGDGMCGLGQPCVGPSGVAVAFNGTLIDHTYAPTSLFGDGLYASTAPWNHVLDGPIGEHVAVTGSQSSTWRWAPAWESVRLLPFPIYVPTDSVVLTGPQQHAQYTFTDLGAQAFRRYSMQALCIDPSGAKRTSNALEVLHLNRTVGPDCNGNGINDIVEIFEGTTPDANNNFVPDGCPGG
jgi:hypothetical protein